MVGSGRRQQRAGRMSTISDEFILTFMSCSRRSNGYCDREKVKFCCCVDVADDGELSLRSSLM